MAHIALFAFDLEPKHVAQVKTRYRSIVTPIPVPESVPLLKTLRDCEPRAMCTQAPVVWDRAEGFQIHDPHGNCWIDFTSGIVVANSGHGHPHVREALRRHLDAKPLHSYLFATEVRARLVRKLIDITPRNLTKALLLSSGTEATEAAIKLARLYGLQQSPAKTMLVSFTGSFHGRTMGAQLLFDAPQPKRWITYQDTGIHHIPFPRCCQCPWGREYYEQCGNECFMRGLNQLQRKGVPLDRTAAFFVEGYQGLRGPIFWPEDYMRALRGWADQHQALIAVDEIQSGFGRTGKLFAYQHYGVDMDIVCCGKGLSSGLPLSAVLARGDLLDIPEPGDMTSTHTGNPLCCAATLASIEVLENENLIEAAVGKGKVIEDGLQRMQRRHPDRVDMISGRGLVYGLFLVRRGSREPDVDLANRLTERAIHKGVMLFLTGNGTLKICPPLVIPQEALTEGIEALGEALDECLIEEVT